jgi:hypothetical protein
VQNKTKVVKNVDWQLFFRLLKWVVPIAIAFVVFNKFYKNAELDFNQLFDEILGMKTSLIFILLLFSILNWSVEVRKWQYLICKLELQSFKVAGKSVLAGVAVSQLLPYRVGEYLGRLAYVKDENKIKGGILSVFGSISQLFFTLFFGLPAFVYLFFPQLSVWHFVALFSMMFLVLLVFMNLSRFQLLAKNNFVQKIVAAWEMLQPKDILRLLTFSLVRYLLFLTPYALLLAHFQLIEEHAYYTLFSAVACIFFLQSVSPNFILSDLAIRVSVPTLVLSQIAEVGQGLDFLPGLIIYVFNLLLPMCLGAIVFLSIQLKKS